MLLVLYEFEDEIGSRVPLCFFRFSRMILIPMEGMSAGSCIVSDLANLLENSERNSDEVSLSPGFP